jgi:seryl-tRNA synthetase
MLEIAFIRQNPEVVIDRLAVKNFDAKTAISEILNLDEKKRAIQTKLEDLLAELNKASKEIGD